MNSVAEALSDLHTFARRMVVETVHPHFGTVRQLASPVRVGDQSIPYRRAPRRNEDVSYILKELLGYGPDRATELRADGAFGPPEEQF